MNKVKIKRGLWYSQKISGTFPLAHTFKTDSNSKKAGFIWVEKDDKQIKLHVNENDFEIFDAQKAIPMEKISENIEIRFDVMETLIEGVISRHIKSMIVSGAPGIGKSYTMEKMLGEAKKAEKIDNFKVCKGMSSALGIYLKLFENCNPGDVIVLDDLDSIFGDETALNILKGALDTTGNRTISWMAMNSYFKENDIPQEFEFNGTVVFITNLDFDKMIEKASKLSPHFAALVSRCVYLDLGIHTTREILARINQVMRKTNMLSTLGVSIDKSTEIMTWLLSNCENIRSLSLRTVIQLAQFVRTSPTDWKSIAQVTLLKKFY